LEKTVLCIGTVYVGYCIYKSFVSADATHAKIRRDIGKESRYTTYIIYATVDSNKVSEEATKRL
jgi:uncharacterized protein YktA (UPF0223 family)